ncbi:MAG: ABC transporter ATP-binding protein [Clostridiales bacterium]|nr:ABC transporter ATP-binding protein [Clostridiales bacterium]
MSIEIRDLCFGYCTREVLRKVSFSALEGQILAVLGPNGVGKTTLFRCILGLQSRYSGSIEVDGVDAHTLTARELAHRVAYIPQTHGMAFSYSVLDMVLMGTTHNVAMMSVPKARELDAANTALVRMGIANLSEKNFSHLSGGEQQLVLIARALAQNTKTLLMDEPTASLDYGNQSLVLQQVRALADDGYTILLSTHNPQHAIWYADSVLALFNGTVAAFGQSREVVNTALIRTLYGVDATLIETTHGPLISPVIEGDNNR